MRISIVEDHRLFAETLEVALTAAHHAVHRVPMADHAVSTERLVTAVRQQGPDLVLLDLDLGAAGSGVRLLVPLGEAGIPVVVVTSTTERARWGECVRFGALTVLHKATALEAILATIRLVGEGLPALDEAVRDTWLTTYYREDMVFHTTRTRLESLTSREREVLAHLMAGHQVRAIADTSLVSETTVRTQVKSILAKLAVSSQVAAVLAAHNARWRPPTLTEGSWADSTGRRNTS